MFLINLNGKESIYEQIRKQIIEFIKNGILSPNDKLPSVRSLAQQLGINPNTVQKAYQELEAHGYIYTLNKKGAFVANKVDEIADNADAVYVINKLKEQGYSKKQLYELIDDIYKEEVDNAENR